jgi:hypothetical protein
LVSYLNKFIGPRFAFADDGEHSDQAESYLVPAIIEV